MILVVDSETSGLWKDDLDPTDPGQPHMVQLGAQLYDAQGVKRAHLSCLIKPDGWEIEPQAEEKHHISTRVCHRYGLPLVAALVPLMEMSSVAKRIVGHNIQFDRRVIAVSAKRAGASGLWWSRAASKLYCTMEHSAEAVGIPSEFGGFKWPSLEAAVNALCGRGFGQPEQNDDIPYTAKHDADSDIEATYAVYRALEARGLAPGAEPFAMEIE